MCREVKDGNLPCEEPRKSIIGRGSSRYKCLKVGDHGWFECGWRVRWVRLWREAGARSFRVLDFLKKRLDFFPTRIH